MGKGKAKGFKPPKAGAPGSMLLGNADHLTGDSIASPVQLRQEGRALPKDHPNFGDEWGKGDGKGNPDDPKGNHPSATGSNDIPLDGKTPVKVLPPKSKAKALAKPEDAPAAPAKPVITPTRPVASDGLSEIERRRAAMSEIEKRRQAMLERERASQQPAFDETDGDDAEARRRHALGQDAKGEAKDEAAEDEPMGVAEPVTNEGEEEEDEEDEVSRAAARRRRLQEDEEDQKDSKKIRVEEQPQAEKSGAMKQGLQHWAERVNALASDGADAELAQLCRDFVRKRILRAHAEGNLHSVDWGEEPVPSAEELFAEAA